ncbi:MAG: hypothetical protein QT05_C0009G0025 [archaeon GW2011_AR13]|nr:MAG: hypothetical protein QT05_C0009G0025 [archaeon GW2011_AR13]
MGGLLRKLTDLLTLNFFYPVSEKNVPRWVRNASNRFYSRKGVRPYNKVIFLKGKNHVYKIWYEMLGQAQIETHYYKKRKTS